MPWPYPHPPVAGAAGEVADLDHAYQDILLVRKATSVWVAEQAPDVTGATDAGAAFQTSFDALGSTAVGRGGQVEAGDGHFRVDNTLLWDKKSGIFQGRSPGHKSGPYGTIIRWGGAAGGQVLKQKRSRKATWRNFRVIGDETNKAASLINVRQDSGDSPFNTGNTYDCIALGGGYGDTTGKTAIDGFVVDGFNAQGDQSTIRNLQCEDFVNSCLAFRATQEVLWKIETFLPNAATYGIEVGTRLVRAENMFSSSMTGADIYITADGQFDVEQIGSENSARLALTPANAGADLWIHRGYWQAKASAIDASGNVVDLTSSGGLSFRMEEFNFTREGGYAGPQEKIKLRGGTLICQLRNTGIPGPPDTVLDVATTGAGQTRRVYLENVQDVLTGNRYDGVYIWAHGDPVPSFNGNVTYYRGPIQLPYNVPLQASQAGGTVKQLISMTGANHIAIGDSSTPIDVANDISGAGAAGLMAFVALQLGGSSGPVIRGGTGAPNNAVGADGDGYWRKDGGAGTTLYQRRAGAYVGIV